MQTQDTIRSNVVSAKSDLKHPTGPGNRFYKLTLTVNHLLEKLLGVRKEKIKDTLGININSLEESLNAERIIEKYNIVAVIDLDEIIDSNYELDSEEFTNNSLTEKLPGFLLITWNKFTVLANLY